MKSIRFFFLICLLTLAAKSLGQGFLRTYNLVSPNSRILTATPTPDGGFIFFGDGLNSTPAWLVKTDPLGEVQWTREVQVTNTDVQADLYVTPDGHYALANYIDNTSTNSFFLFDAQGNQLKKVDFQGFTRIAMTSNGFLASNRVSDQAYKLFHLDWQGNIVWEKTKPTQFLGLLYDMTATQDGGLCMMTAYDSLGNRFPKLIKADANGEVEWERFYNFSGVDFYGRIIQNAQGQFVCTNQLLTSVSSVLFAADANGDSLWSKTIDLYALGLCETTDGGYAITGEKPLTEGVNVIKTDAGGNTLFSKIFNFNNSYYGVGWDIAATTDGGVLISSLLDSWATLIKTDANGNIYPNFITGKVAFDQNHNCQIGANEPDLKNWTVVATETSGQKYYATTNDTGFYELNVNLGNYTVEIHTPGPLWEPCDDQFAADLSAPSTTVNLNFPVQDSVLCSLLDVSLSTPFLRRCFDSQYFVSWCNRGTTAAFNAFIEIVLPPELDFVSASQAVTQVGDTLRFDIGTVNFSECGDLNFIVNVNCDSTVLGQTLCVEARIYPDTICYETQNWSGARVVATARCLADTAVEFRLRNVGDAATQMLDYIITEDLVVLMQGDFDLDPGEEKIVIRNANGTTQRIEAGQESGYPFASFSSATIEGCGNAPSSFGFVNQFSLDDASPFADIECREVVGSYDPNDKQGFPNGYGNQHFIEPGTDITYLIRFQNTGTDTAFFVTIRDTLSAFLDPASVRPGAASHPYTWELTGPGALTFRFDNILLPDSNVNEAASHGFVQFRISQRSDVPLGTIIENDAAIFFDYNAPVITNTTFHTVGEHFYTVSVENEPGSAFLPVKVSPNPLHEQAVISLPEALPGEATFRLFDYAGRAVREVVFSGNTFEFSAINLPAGLYFFDIKDDKGQMRSRGKMVVN